MASINIYIHVYIFIDAIYVKYIPITTLDTGDKDCCKTCQR